MQNPHRDERPPKRPDSLLPPTLSNLRLGHGPRAKNIPPNPDGAPDEDRRQESEEQDPFRQGGSPRAGTAGRRENESRHRHGEGGRGLKTQGLTEIPGQSRGEHRGQSEHDPPGIRSQPGRRNGPRKGQGETPPGAAPTPGALPHREGAGEKEYPGEGRHGPQTGPTPSPERGQQTRQRREREENEGPMGPQRVGGFDSHRQGFLDGHGRAHSNPGAIPRIRWAR